MNKGNRILPIKHQPMEFAPDRETTGVRRVDTMEPQIENIYAAETTLDIALTKDPYLPVGGLSGHVHMDATELSALPFLCLLGVNDRRSLSALSAISLSLLPSTCVCSNAHMHLFYADLSG